MAVTYTPIASSALTSATASVTFSSIPSTYTDLVLVTNASNSGSSSIDLFAQVNSSTSSIYYRERLLGNGSTASSDPTLAESRFVAGRTSATGSKANSICNFMSYSNTTTYKTMLTRGNDSASLTFLTVNLWQSTSAINSIYLFSATAVNFEAGSTFTLYGIKAA